jgi:hypothetical protein
MVPADAKPAVPIRTLVNDPYSTMHAATGDAPAHAGQREKQT